MTAQAQLKPSPDSIGVDVSRTELVVAERRGEAIRRYTVVNTPSAASDLAEALVGRGFTAKLVIEATGAYHWPLVLAASERGLDVRLINPLQAAKHRQGRVRKCKTDPVDAAVLADMALTERELPPPFALDRATIRLRQHVGLLDGLETQIQSLQGLLRSHRENAALAGVAGAEAAAALEAELERLKAHREALQAEIDQLARSLDTARRRRSWSKLPGVTVELGALLGALLDPRGRSAKSWVGFLGIDISVHQSGQRVGRGRLSKRGSPYLRKRLFQAAWGAMMNFPQARAYYDRLRGQGRAHKEALTIIARRLIRAGFALVHHPDREVDQNRLFPVGG